MKSRQTLQYLRMTSGPPTLSPWRAYFQTVSLPSQDDCGQNHLQTRVKKVDGDAIERASASKRTYMNIYALVSSSTPQGMVSSALWTCGPVVWLW